MQMVFQVQNFLDLVMLLFICFLLFHVALWLPHSTFDSEITLVEGVFKVKNIQSKCKMLSIIK